MSKKNKFKIKKNKNDFSIHIAGGYNNLSPVFSFSKYIESSEYFSKEHSKDERNSLYNFLVNIREFSKFTWGKIKENPQIFHFHPVEKNIPILNEYLSVDLAQFKVPGLKQGRLIGFLDEQNVFNILLYDSQHNIYSRK